MTRYRYRRRRRSDIRGAAAAVAAGLFLAVLVHAAGRGPAAAAAPPAPRRTVAAVISYARAQLGKPYEWGGTGPAAFDCSGLVMQAYAAAGISIPRTSQEQWARGPRVTRPRPGDLVFFPGSDGTWAAPGHVGLVIGRHLMIEAYATGFPIRISAFGTAAAAPGDETPVGFTRPAEHAGAR